MSKKPEIDAGTKRATEFNECMQNVPGYADDSIFFMMRYITKVREKLRKCDYEEFTRIIGEMDTTISKHKGAEALPAQEAEKVAVLKAQGQQKIEEHPELLKDFDAFLQTSGRYTKQIS